MKLLLDQNLSDRLVRGLRGEYPNSSHVRLVGLERADEVWSYAREHGFAILSKDSDFHQRSLLYGHPPKVVWVRKGNCSTSDIEQSLKSHLEDLEAFDRDPDASFLILP